MSRKSKTPKHVHYEPDPYEASLSYYSESSASSHKGHQDPARYGYRVPPQHAPSPSSSEAPFIRQGSGVDIKTLGARIMQEQGSTQPSQRYKPGPDDLKQRRPNDKNSLPATLDRRPAIRDPSRDQISRENTRDNALAAHAAAIRETMPEVIDHPQYGKMRRVEPTADMRNLNLPGESLGFYQVVPKSSKQAGQAKSQEKEKKKKKGWFS